MKPTTLVLDTQQLLALLCSHGMPGVPRGAVIHYPPHRRRGWRRLA